MKILSIQTGKVAPIDYKGKAWPTAIRKQPRQGPIHLGRLGLDGDEIGNPEVHGGEGRALYVFAKSHYSLWQGRISQELLEMNGLFGENLTVDSMDEFNIHVGDQFTVGECLIEATTPRFPCFLFAERVGYPEAQKFMNENKRSGVLFRVLKEGSIHVGDSLSLFKKSEFNLTMTEFLYKGQAGVITREFLDQVLAIPVVPKITKDRLEYRLIHGR